eukprot:g2202.t1
MLLAIKQNECLMIPIRIHFLEIIYTARRTFANLCSPPQSVCRPCSSDRSHFHNRLERMDIALYWTIHTSDTLLGKFLVRPCVLAAASCRRLCVPQDHK